MSGRSLDRASLVGGIVLVVVGVILLLDRTGSLDLGFGALWPMLAAAVGAVLLAAGMDDRRRGR